MEQGLGIHPQGSAPALSGFGPHSHPPVQLFALTQPAVCRQSALTLRNEPGAPPVSVPNDPELEMGAGVDQGLAQALWQCLRGPQCQLFLWLISVSGTDLH